MLIVNNERVVAELRVARMLSKHTFEQLKGSVVQASVVEVTAPLRKSFVVLMPAVPRSLLKRWHRVNLRC